MSRICVIRQLILVLLLCTTLQSYSQAPNIGILSSRNYSKQDYKAGTQSWDFAQDKRGVLYFANNNGLLIFDGVKWNCLPISNQTIVRSIAIDEDGRIYVGGQGELGYFLANEAGQLVFHSLLHLIPDEDRNFADIWDIVILGKEIFFRSDKRIFHLKEDQMQVHKSNHVFQYMGLLNDKVVIQEQMHQLLYFNGQSFVSQLEQPLIQSPITAILEVDTNRLLIATLKNGLFLFKDNELKPISTPNDDFFIQNRIYCAKVLPNQQLAIGSSLAGLLILDKQLRIVRQMNKDRGLQNNNVLSLGLDRAQNLWLGLDTGIDYVATNSPFTLIYPDGQLEGTGYAVNIFNNNIYFGTSNGLYATEWKNYYNPLSNQPFSYIDRTSGQVWGMDQVDNTLLLGHHEGPFELKGYGAQRISPMPGAWTYVAIDEEHMIGGNYSGLSLFQKTATGWEFKHQLEGLEESCRIMMMDKAKNLWIAHPYRGIYKVQIEEGMKKVKAQFYNSQNGLPSDLFNHVFNINQQPIFSSEKGLYHYSEGKDGFELDSTFTQMLGKERRIKSLQQDAQGNIWYVADDEVGLIHITDKGLKKQIQLQAFPELADKLVGGFEHIYPYDEHNVFFATEKGFVHYNPSQEVPKDSLQLILNGVWTTIGNDSLLFGGIFNSEGQLLEAQNEAIATVLASHYTGIRFSYAATNYQYPGDIRYQSKLEGLEEEWSSESSKTERDFTNLESGNYTFLLRARSPNGQLSKTLSYRFKIEPPWYAGPLAIAMYILLGMGGLATIILMQRNRFEMEKAELQSAHQKKEKEHLQLVQQSEEQITQLQNEKLEAEIQHKNQELASATMHLVQKGEILLKVQERLDKVMRLSKDPDLMKKEIRQIISLLSQDTQLDNDWEQFAYHFDQVHSDFLMRLRDNFPQLSPNDSKICAYLRMNLSTKEIAPLMNISIRGVEASRYRLRKKLNLTGDTNLVDFLLQV